MSILTLCECFSNNQLHSSVQFLNLICILYFTIMNKYNEFDNKFYGLTK